MADLTYQFDLLRINSAYIFQTLKDRMLSDEYHAHDFYEWIVLFEGACVTIIDGDELELSEHTSVLLKPGQSHNFIGQTASLNILVLSIERTEFERMADAFGVDTLPWGVPEKLSSGQARVLLEFCGAENETEYKLLLANLLKIHIDLQKKESRAPVALICAMREMAQTENLCGGVERFCVLSGYSKSQLNRLMKQYFNTTSHGFIFDTRMELAYNALVLTNTHMEEIAEYVGYASFSHFNKAFKCKYGITPAALRKKCIFRTV